MCLVVVFILCMYLLCCRLNEKGLFDYLLLNDDLDATASELERIAEVWWWTLHAALDHSAAQLYRCSWLKAACSWQLA